MLAGYRLMTEATFSINPDGTPGGPFVVPEGQRLWFLTVKAPTAGPAAVIVWKDVTITVDPGDVFTISGDSIPNCGTIATEVIQITGAARAVAIIGPPSTPSVSLAHIGRGAIDSIRKLFRLAA